MEQEQELGQEQVPVAWVVAQPVAEFGQTAELELPSCPA